MIVEILRKLGLNRHEIDVYLALLEIGQTTSGPLVKKTRIPSSKIYHILGGLIEKGLVGYLHYGGVKHFRVNKPLALRHLLDLKEQELSGLKSELETALPSLESEYEAEKTEYRVELFEGLRGIKSVYDISFDQLKKGEEMYTIGYPVLASQLLNAYFKEFHKKLAKKGIVAKILYDYDTWFSKKREPRPHAEQRYLPKGIKTPAFIHIFKDHIGIMVVTEKQKLSIFIKNKEVADSYIHYFNLLWRVGREPE
ncbi:HTH-type sugar sensing transcriptional regulator TrmB [Candidatus Bilamarchaeum dharawalense]|uniref:HTH-type sugar sensing transcriptional regulator TrmB n=1 Tax=Candidatus Bilamarchaeum dharawalense TaxID=2885759 RepID=A0A5E4LVW5_9ARCH|nr:HTH-type sugar sensing transcriptional regulator TrmB [Candidatus Bilamarchaeum dharawalense]